VSQGIGEIEEMVVRKLFGAGRLLERIICVQVMIKATGANGGGGSNIHLKEEWDMLELSLVGFCADDNRETLHIMLVRLCGEYETLNLLESAFVVPAQAFTDMRMRINGKNQA